MRRAVVLLCLLLAPASLMAQDREEDGVLRRRVVSYNVENLFDTIDDPETDDREFLPDGSRHWTERRYRQKVRHISAALSRIGGWDFPALIGLVEVENLQVVRDLVSSEALRRMDYRMSVTRGADPRGIDVALLWDPKLFRRADAQEIPHYGPLECYPLRRDPRSRRERDGTGRNSLWVTLEERHSGALLDLFVVHLPSRRGGVRSTSDDRVRVAAKLRRVIDRLFRERPDAAVIILGDFNDDPHNDALTLGLGAVAPSDDPPDDHRLYNLAAAAEAHGRGSHYFGRGYWLPDQIIVSGRLLRPESPIRAAKREMAIYAPPFLQDRRHRPLRSFQGLHYTGGYSDHYPVCLDLLLERRRKGDTPTE